MKLEDIQEMMRIVEKYIPLGSDTSLCHVGICSIRRCDRCQSAIKIRELIGDIVITKE